MIESRFHRSFSAVRGAFWILLLIFAVGDRVFAFNQDTDHICRVNCASSPRVTPSPQASYRDSYQRGFNLYTQGKYSDALQQLEISRGLAPNEIVRDEINKLIDTVKREWAATDARLLNQQAMELLKANKTDAAEKKLESAATLNPNDKVIGNNLTNVRARRLNEEGLRFYSEKKWTDAILKFTSALKYTPDDTTIWKNLENAKSAQRAEDENRIATQMKNQIDAFGKELSTAPVPTTMPGIGFPQQSGPADLGFPGKVTDQPFGDAWKELKGAKDRADQGGLFDNRK